MGFTVRTRRRGLHPSRPLLAGVAAGAALLVVAPLQAGAATADDVNRSAQIDKPAVALVEFDASAVAQNVQTGQIFSSFANPNQPVSVSFIGTGFFVSPDGFLVTAAHLAAPSDNALKQSILTELYSEALQSGNCNNCNPDPAQDAAANADSYTLSSVQKSVTVYTQDLNLTSKPQGLTAEVRQSSPAEQNDIAVLKVSGANYPTMHVGDSDTAQVGDQVAVIGYPATGIQNVDLGSVTSPTTTFGRVTNRVQQQGFDRIQADATAEHGNSGGPLVAANGDVVGIVSNGPTSTTNFFIPSNAVRDLVREAGADNSFGQVDTLWRSGMAAYAGQHYDDAAKIFAQCATLSKVQVGCSQYQVLATERHAQNVPEPVAAAPAASSGGHGLLIVLGIVAGLIVVAGAVVGVLFGTRRRGAPGVGAPVAPRPPVMPVQSVPSPPAAVMADTHPVPSGPVAGNGAPVAGNGAPAAPAVAPANGNGTTGQRHFCPSCGARLGAESRFCEGCGQRLGEPVA